MSEADDYYKILCRVQTHCDIFLKNLPIKNNPYGKISNDIQHLFLRHGRAEIVRPTLKDKFERIKTVIETAEASMGLNALVVEKIKKIGESFRAEPDKKDKQ